MKLMLIAVILLSSLSAWAKLLPTKGNVLFYTCTFKDRLGYASHYFVELESAHDKGKLYRIGSEGRKFLSDMKLTTYQENETHFYLIFGPRSLQSPKFDVLTLATPKKLDQHMGSPREIAGLIMNQERDVYGGECYVQFPADPPSL